jgi:hypothetical protein
MNGYHFGYKQKILEKTLVMVHADQPKFFCAKICQTGDTEPNLPSQDFFLFF